MIATLQPLAVLLALAASRELVRFFFHLGLVGLFLISSVDSSFIPLPIPGITDIMIGVYAANHANVILLVLIATAGSAAGGLFSHAVGHAGGMKFLEKNVPPRILKRVTAWMERHSIIAVALPAILPPPMPLSPFVLAAGALKMSERKFMITFTTSRMARHGIAAWLGVIYGKPVLRFWREFSAKWGTTILVVVWVGIAISVSYAMWQLWKTRQELSGGKMTGSKTAGAKPAAAA